MAMPMQGISDRYLTPQTTRRHDSPASKAQRTSSRQSRGKRRLSAAPEASSLTGFATRGFSNHTRCRLLVPGCSICARQARHRVSPEPLVATPGLAASAVSVDSSLTRHALGQLPAAASNPSLLAQDILERCFGLQATERCIEEATSGRSSPYLHGL